MCNAKLKEKTCRVIGGNMIIPQYSAPTRTLSLEDFKALEETAYLLRSPTNARRILSAAAQLNAGKGVERKLAE